MMARRKCFQSTEAPAEARLRYETITGLTDAFCERYLNDEYAMMCRRLATELARKQPTPLKRGRAEVWACGIVPTIGWANMLDDPKSSPSMKLIDIDPEFGVANSTGQGNRRWKENLRLIACFGPCRGRGLRVLVLANAFPPQLLAEYAAFTFAATA